MSMNASRTGWTQRHSYLHGLSLHKLMQVYGSIIRSNPRLWLRGLSFTADDYRRYPDIARALGVDVLPIEEGNSETTTETTDTAAPVLAGRAA